ncbi:MAG TPA: YibE/F family protein, partial [Blastococcus sp.]
MPSTDPHTHRHGPDPDAPPPSAEALGRRRRAVWLMLLLLVPVGLATVIGLVALWPGSEPTRAEQVAETYLPPGTTYPDAEVVSMETFDCATDPAVPADCADVVVEVLDGEGAGDFQQIQLEAPVVAAGIEKGDVLVLTRDAGAEGGAAYGFYDYARNTPII